MLRLMDELERRGVDFGELRALEIFGRDGLDHTTTYANRVKSLEVWELDPKWHPVLVKNLPGATVRTVDSYAEVTRTPDRFDLIMIDNAIGKNGDRYDHFDLFPDAVFKATADESLLVLIVIPTIDGNTLKHFPELLDKGYLERRKSFYAADDPVSIPMERVVDVYRSFAERNGYRLLWAHHQIRSGAGVRYLALKIRKN